MPETFADVLGHYVQRSHYAVPQVAALSGVSRRTIANWLGGIALKPQQWQAVVKVAAALKLNEAETSHLLAAAGHPPIAELRQTTYEKELALLAPWPPSEQAPFQAVADLPYFVGRESAMHELEQVLQQGQQVAICNLHGMGGVGKTSLAAHLAYRLRGQFPDGILWARLDTTDTMTILSAFADAYGKNVSEYRDVESRSAVVRSLLADRRALVILDNAESSKQVRPLLPPNTGKTAVILTTRHDLAVADQMHCFPIESFDPTSGESLAVFAYFLGQRTITRWQSELQSIADLLGHLPLAVAIAAGQLAHGRVPIPHFLTQLQQSDQRLGALIREDLSVRLSFDVSYRALSPELQQFFAALGAFGGDDFDVTVVAYVTELSEPDARARLDILGQLSLVQMTRPTRYRLHPLLRDYARENMPSEMQYIRMASFYINLVESLEAYTYQVLLPDISNILATITITRERQLHEHFLRCVTVYHRFLFSQGHIIQHDKDIDHAIQIAPNLGSKLLLADLLAKKGRIKAETGYFQESNTLFLEALAHIDSDNNHDEQTQRVRCDILNGLAATFGWQGELQTARKYHEAGWKLANEINYTRAIIVSGNNLGGLLYEEGRYGEAILLYQEALARARQSHDYHLVINILHSLASVHALKLEYDEAVVYLREGEKLGRIYGHTTSLIGVLGLQSTICYKTGDLAQADVYLQEATDIARQTGYLRALLFLLAETGKRSLTLGDYAKAASCLNEASSIARQQGLTGRHFRILHYLGELYLAQQQYQAATQIWNEVLEKAQEKIYIVAAYWGLICTARMQNKVDLAQHYQDRWQETVEELIPHEKKTLKWWLPDLLVEN
ncbi:MAG: tetratricopeptide repeat protein [Anaerolineae bacterium]|nr:tetratricopeptide repeat protein [Anaerolineae bacterium]